MRISTETKKASKNTKRAPKLIAAGLAGIALLSACSNSNESTPKAPEQTTASANATPNVDIKIPSPESTLAGPSVSATPEFGNYDNLDTNYDEAEVIKWIGIEYMHAPEERIAAIEFARNPELAMQIGANELWWKAQIEIAKAHIESDNAVRNLPGDPDSHGFSYSAGFYSKALLPLYANGLKIAQENNIPIYPPDAVSRIEVNGHEIALSNLSMSIDIMSPTQSKEYKLCANMIKPIDESLYTTSNPTYEGKDEPTVEIIKQLDLKIKQITIDYLEAIDSPCIE